MRERKYHIRLNEEEREMLRAISGEMDGSEPMGRIVRACILLELDEGLEGREVPSREEIARRCQCAIPSVSRVSRLYTQGGVERVVNRKPRPPVEPVISGEAVEKIRALYDGEIPAGYKRWTYPLLAVKAVEGGIVRRISITTARTIVLTRNGKDKRGEPEFSL
jgi:hypothetical protein